MARLGERAVISVKDSAADVAALEAAGLSAMSDFESTAADLAVTYHGRLVKLIGDEVMFISPDETAACNIGLQLADAADAHAVLPAIRVGNRERRSSVSRRRLLRVRRQPRRWNGQGGTARMRCSTR